MPSTPEIIAGVSSSIVRLSAYVFLRWIPGHLWPPITLTSLVIYLACVFGQSEAFGTSRPTLHEAFPKLFQHPDEGEKPSEQAETAVAHDEIHEEGPKEVQVEVHNEGHEIHEEGPEEVQVKVHNHEEPVFYEDEKSLFKTFFFGIPNWREAGWSYVTIGLNVLLALLTLDLIFRGPLLHPANDISFTRVGYVDTNSAKVLIREPDPAQFPIYVYLSPADKTNWKTTDTIYYTGPDTDYTHALTFDGLQPSRKYIYSLSNDKSGTFITAPSPYTEAANTLTFLTSSCIKANFPYRVTSHSLAIRGFDYLSKVVRSLPSPASFMLFLGDFIYVDVPIRLSSSLEHYRSEYRRVYASPSWSLPGLDSLPWIHTLDDHEIANDWSGGNDTEPFLAASDPFIHYHVSVNPSVPSNAPAGPESNTTYFQFSNGPASFFMLDTRRYRTDPEPKSSSSSPSEKPAYRSSSGSSNPPSFPNKHSMLGAHQVSSLLTYLATPEPPHIHWKIIASSVPFTKNWRFGTSDTWGGFLRERASILQAMHDAERELGIRVIVLSGDRHEFAAIRYPPPVISLDTLTPEDAVESSFTSGAELTSRPIQYDTTPAAGPHEFSCGPLSMFYLPIRTFRQVDSEDVAIKYIPDGNSKVGVVEIRNLAGEAGWGEGQRSVLKYSLYVDGEVKWEYTVTSPSPSSALGLRSRGRERKKGWAQRIGFSRTGAGSAGRSLWD